MGTDHGGSSSSLLSTLRTAVKKVRFLLSFSATRWILSSISGESTSRRRRLSFGSRQPSLLDAAEAPYGRTVSLGAPPSTAGTVSRTSSGASSTGSVSRTSSGASSSVGASSPARGDEDIDRRAEQFIANFHKHIQMERQVSLELRYCLERSATPPPVSFR